MGFLLRTSLKVHSRPSNTMHALLGNLSHCSSNSSAIDAFLRPSFLTNSRSLMKRLTALKRWENRIENVTSHDKKFFSQELVVLQIHMNLHSTSKNLGPMSKAFKVSQYNWRLTSKCFKHNSNSCKLKSGLFRFLDDVQLYFSSSAVL